MKIGDSVWNYSSSGPSYNCSLTIEQWKIIAVDDKNASIVKEGYFGCNIIKTIEVDKIFKTVNEALATLSKENLKGITKIKINHY